MQNTITEFLSLRRMPSSRGAYAMQKTLELCDQQGVPAPLRERVEQACQVAQTTVELELDWEQARTQTSTARGNAAQIDMKLDQAIAAIGRILDGELLGPDESPHTQAARQIQNVIFPAGISAVIHVSYEHQHVTIDALVARLQNQLKEQVALLGMERHVERVHALNQRFGKELDRDERPALTYDEVVTSREALHVALCQVVAAAFEHLRADADAPTLSAVLAPLVEQQQRTHAYVSRRRAVPPVDPGTGAELPAEHEPSTEPQLDPAGA
ncbi:hypothetical protein DL240_02365 [Lujinxingia litoralis]|uniref:Uncharacterized protein n=1 Tax=Lujinxingia litoralis TaxID=2211119 RepID=A0A328CDL9_9DELT|nr:DUF6261 family protein [Lujinxingia litoralis]RAL25079.1 hypothetical protein DL240_02365 [Lujinxingia litoralis]